MKYSLLYSLLITCFTPSTYAQSYKTDQNNTGIIACSLTPDSPAQYTYVEKMPLFKGDLGAYFSKNEIYPADAKRKHIEGRVILKFVVSETGKVTDVKVVKGIYPSLDSEAVCLIKYMPDWIPGENEGKPVSIFYTLPVVFKLTH